jgi:Zn-dependent protease
MEDRLFGRMEQHYPPPPPPAPPPAPPLVTPQPEWGREEPGMWQKLKKLLAPLGIVLVVIAKFLAKLKFLILPVLKFFPVILKTGGTMILSIGVYALTWGVWFGVGFVLLIFVHECGHLLVARRLGLKVGAPVFIPFMGAFIALKEAPRNAWIESQVGIGGPMLGTLGAGCSWLIYLWTDKPIFSGLAYTGFFLNLFNLAPVGFLDGGRIVTALSPWLWLVGFAVLLVMTILHPNLLLIFILIASVPRVISLFRKRSDEEQRYFEVTPQQRWTMAAMYFGLVALLAIGMRFSHIDRDGNRTASASGSRSLELNSEDQR